MSEKYAIFSDMDITKTKPSPSRSSKKGIELAMRKRIKLLPPNKVFSPATFLDLGSRTAIDKTLSRMTASGELRRIARGLYNKPHQHPLLGTMLPTAEEIMHALESKTSQRLQPSGAYAANLLGLSEQVPMKLVFLTDGSSRSIRIGSQLILLKHTTPRNMATAGRISGLLIQALRYLKQKNSNADIIQPLKKRLSPEDKQILLNDAHLAPIWISRIMQELATDSL